MLLRSKGIRQSRAAFAKHATPSLQRLSTISSAVATAERPPVGLSNVLSQTSSDAQLRSTGVALEDGTKKPSARARYVARQTLRNQSKELGSVVERRHLPNALLEHPPAPRHVTLELLMAAQTHMGHNASTWNPANSRYIQGIRQGIHIISLEATAAHLRRAARVVEEVAYAGGLILFVGTRKGQMGIVTRAAAMAQACHLFTKWIPGTITNRDILLRKQEIQIVNENDLPVQGLERHLLERRPLLPDLVVCLNPLENYTLLYECGLKNIPTIGVIDTDADPSWVTYTIPANDDSMRSIAVIAGVLGRAGQAGQRRRLADANAGIVKWQTPVEVKRFMTKTIDQEDLELKRKMRLHKTAAKEAALEKGMNEDMADTLWEGLEKEMLAEFTGDKRVQGGGEGLMGAHTVGGAAEG